MSNSSDCRGAQAPSAESSRFPGWPFFDGYNRALDRYHEAGRRLQAAQAAGDREAADWADREAALDAVAATGLGAWEHAPASGKGGRPTRRLRLH